MEGAVSKTKEKTIVSSAHKKYILDTNSTERTLLTRNEMMNINRYFETNKEGRVGKLKEAPSSVIPKLPFEEIHPKGDDELKLSIKPIYPHESALDVPLRFITPEEYHAPAFEDPPAQVPLARRVVALLKGAESAPMTWSRNFPTGRGKDRSTAQITMLSDAESRVQACQRAGEWRKMAHALCTEGCLHYNYGNIERAVDAFSKALSCFEKLNDARGVAFAHNILGVCFYRLGKYKNALMHHLKQDSLGGCYARAVAKINIGVSYSALGELEFAEQAFEDALAHAQASEDNMIETIALGNLGLVSFRVGNMRAAQTNLENCLEKCSMAGDRSGAAICLLLLGEVYSLIHDHQHALFYYDHAFRVGGEANNADVVDFARVSIGIARGNAAIRDAVVSQAAAMGKQNDLQCIVKLLPV